MGIRDDSRIGIAGGGGIHSAGSDSCGDGERGEGGEESGAGSDSAGVSGGYGFADGKSVGGCEGVLRHRCGARGSGSEAGTRALREVYDSGWSGF